MRSFLLILALSIASFSFAQNQEGSAKKRNITLEDIWRDGTFKIKSVPGFKAMNDGKRFTKIDEAGKLQEINVYDLQTGNKLETLFNTAITNDSNFRVSDYDFSKDESKLLLFTKGQNIYRRSVLYKVYVYDIAAKKIALVDESKILHATFSPDGSKVAYVKENNLYVEDLKTEEKSAITTDGKKNEIINGNCDWVYEEEFAFTRAFEWAPDGNHIAYYRFDERLVPEYTFMHYDSLYPRPYKYKYPVAGQPNSIIQIKIYDVNSHRTISADIGNNPDQYIPRIKWMKDPNQLCVYRMNRHQNKLELLSVIAGSGDSKVIYTEKNPYYIDINDNIQFLADKESFIFNSEQSGYNHFYRWNWKTKKQTALTKGDFDIDQLVGVDENNKLLYYTAAETSPLQRQLYAVDFDGNNKRLITPEKGTHAITPIDGNQFFLDKYSRLNLPPIYYLRKMNGEKVRVLEDNVALRDTMQHFNLGELRFTQFPGAEKGVLLNAWIMTPPNFDSTKQYPVLMFQYSGPGSQQVADRFPIADYFWHQMLTEKGYIVVCADGTGTGFRGEAFKKKTYLTLGNLESNDQIAIAKYLATVSYVDVNRIGIWGWSYGGFMSSTCMFKGNDVFKAGIAVAPVTNWRYYDNIYTERYMHTPQENPKGYDDNAPEKMADQLSGKFLLIHGTGDDNVHFQNSVMLVNALIKANKQFDSEYYPNRTHGISGGNTRYQLYTRMTNFILQNL